MFLLILKALTVFSTEREALHSTMFLLILSNDWFVILLFQSLHSTMFLLIRCISEWTLLWVPGFTFHNVSINTVFTGETETLKDLFTFHNVSINTDFLHKLSVSFASLHSTMFLLIQITNFHSAICTIIFTFHNVSINTRTSSAPYIIELSLHSTMFLLIPRAPHSPIIHRLFYHFLSTLSFTIILYTK